MVEHVLVRGEAGQPGPTMQSLVVLRHDPEKLSAALANLLGVPG